MNTKRLEVTWHARPALAKVADDRGASGRADRDDPLLGAFAHDLDRAIRAQVTEPDPGRLGDPQPGVELEQEDRPVAHGGEPEESPESVVGHWLDELVGDALLAECSQCAGFGEPFRLELVPKHLEGPDVAGHADRGEGRPELDEPCSQVRPGQSIDRAIGAERADRPVEDHPVPGDRLGRRALGRLRAEEQIDRPTKCRGSKESDAQ